MTNIKKILHTRMGFFSLAVILFWIKTYIGYQSEFSLGVEGIMQQFILLINPIATTIILLSIALYFKSSKKAYIALVVVYALMSILFFSNILYYR